MCGASLLLSACAAIDPVTLEERALNSKEDLNKILAAQEPVSGPVDLYVAMARALKYNLDSKVELMREHFASGDYKLAHFDLLPTNDSEGGYEGRSNTQASSSQSVLTGRESLEPSTSLDNNRAVLNLSTVWSTLDLGVSYLRLKQKENQIYIAHESRRRTINRLTQEVRRSYWRVAASNAVSGELSRLRAAASSGMRRARQAEAEGLESAEQVSDFERRILRVIASTTLRQRELALAKVELAALMGLDAGYTYNIGGARFAEHRHPGVEHRASDLRRIALIHRPELYEADYRTRIASLEKSIDIISALPSVQANLDVRADSNQFLVNQFWLEYGAKVVGSIPRLLSIPVRIKRGDARNALVEEQRKAMTMAVVSQVYLSHQAYHFKQRDYRLATQVVAAERRHYVILREKERSSLSNESAYLEAWARYVQARLDQFAAFAEMQAAHARLLESIGIDFIPPNDAEKNSVNAIAHELRHFFSSGSKAIVDRYRREAIEVEQAAMQLQT